MGYSLMVFDYKLAPIDDQQELLAWYNRQILWGEKHDYKTLSVTSPALQNWYKHITQIFPDIQQMTSDELDADEAGDCRAADYYIAREMIFIDFWQNENCDYIQQTVRQLAKQHDVAFYDIYDTFPYIVLPDGRTWDCYDDCTSFGD